MNNILPAFSSTAQRRSHQEASPCLLLQPTAFAGFPAVEDAIRQVLDVGWYNFQHLFAPCETRENSPRSALLIQPAGLGPCYQVQQVLLHLVVSPMLLFIIHIGNHQH